MNLQKNWSPAEGARSTLTEYQINGRWHFNLETGALRSEHGRLFAVRAKTKDVLCLLIENVNKTISVDEFLETVWAGRCPGDSVLRQSIFELRAIFKEHDSDIIETVPKRGYRLNARIEAIEKVENEVFRIEPKREQEKTNTDYKKKLQGKKILLISAIIIFFMIGLVSLLFYNDHPRTTSLNDIELSQYYLSSRSDGFAEDMFSLSTKPNETNYLSHLISDYYDSLRSEAIPDDTKFKKMLSIIRIHLVMENYQEAIVVIKSLIDWTSMRYGHADIRWLLVNLYYFYSTIEVGDIETGDRIQKEIQTALSFVKHNTELFQADFHYVQSLYYLACTYPFCDRPNAMQTGRALAKDAIRQYSNFYGQESIQKADALRLLNWFTPVYPHDKEEILNQALEIYIQQLGSDNARVADVLAELSRIQTVNRLDMEEGEANLQQALAIRQAIYPKGHDILRKTYAYLGELYLALDRKEDAIKYFYDAVNHLSTDKKPSLEALIFLAKTYLYSGRNEEAQAAILQANALADQYRNRIPYFLDYELKAVGMRVGVFDKLLNDEALVSADLNSHANGIKAKNGLPAAILSHEYLTQLLQMNAATLNSDRYLSALDMILKNYRLNHRYLLDADIDFLKNRSMALCVLKSQLFCDAIKEKFSLYHVYM